MDLKILNNWRSVPTEDQILNRELAWKDSKLSGRFESALTLKKAVFAAKMGAGLDRLNIHTITSMALAYSKFLNDKNIKERQTVLIGRDNRVNSELYSNVFAKVLFKNGISVVFFENNEPQPTPMISYAVAHGDFSGGVVIAGSHHSKNHNGIAFLGSSGDELNHDEVELINENINIGAASINDGEALELKYINNKLIANYKKDLVDEYTIHNGTKISLSTHNGPSGKLLADILKKTGATINIEEKQFGLDPEFKYSKTSNPSDQKSFNRLRNSGRKYKSDILLNVDPEGNRLAVSFKYKKRYKILNNNQLSAICLEDLLAKMEIDNLINNESYVLAQNTAGDMPIAIAESYGVKVIVFDGSTQDMNDILKENGIENFIFAYGDSIGFIPREFKSTRPDAIKSALFVSCMVSSFLKKTVNPYDFYKSLEEKYGYHIDFKFNKRIDTLSRKKLLKKVLRAKTIDDKKIADKIVYETRGDKVVKLIYTDGSWSSLEFNDDAETVSFVVESKGGKGVDKLSLFPIKVKFEQWVKDNTETIEDKHISAKGILKYSVFTSVVVGILVIVFLYIYNSSSTSSKNVSIWQAAGWWADTTSTRWVWLIYWVWKCVTLFISAWMKKRMFQRLKEPVKVRHLMISAMMGSVIAFVTPFAIGGDAIGYWYLRRKKVKRSTLVSTMASATVWGESKFAIQTVFLVWVGWPVYKAIFDSGQPEAHAALIWFFAGLTWSIFSSFMILILTINKRFQEFIVKYSVVLLEWMPLIHITELEEKEASVQYEFLLIRTSMRKIWNKWWFVLEMVFYDMIMLFFSPMLLIFISAGNINPNAPAGQYWTPIVINDIIGTANSMSITPGGSGTGEWLEIITRNVQYENTTLTHAPYNLSPESVTSAGNVFYKLFFNWPLLIVSMFTILNVIASNRKKQRSWIKNRTYGIMFSCIIFAGLAIYLLLIIFKVIL